MNKKFLSAILFGALMATSAGTFVSCKDYDDDIKNLQTQIDTNKTAIAELQKLVGAGKWVSSISSIENGFTVTMSDGSSHQIKGINGKDGADGKDGKNGAEWTIGEDGFWYVDGEKTENVAVAKDGKDGLNGVSAPAPYISEDGMWVVYSWDAEKGEFVAEETEIPAAGLCAYAVKANGVYTLFIADENGELQEIALPATSDSFVVESPYEDVVVEFEIATWKKWTTTIAKSEAGKALLAKYPELADIEKNAPMKQGGKLPLIVNPANVDLTDGFSFLLVDEKGKTNDIELSAPVKGADLAWCEDGELHSRSAEETGLWSLSVNPAYNEKNKSYASAYKNALIAKNAKGTSVRTAFAYTLAPTDFDGTGNFDVAINTNNGSWSEVKGGKVVREGLGSKAPYAETIDLFAGVLEEDGVTMTYPISFVNEYNNHYIVVVNDALQAEKYGLSIAEDGHTLNIAKMPASELSIEVELKVIALGLNGSVDTEIVKLTVGQEIAATGVLADKEVTLGYNANAAAGAKYNKNVRWNIADLGFTATQLNQFLNSTKTIAWSYIDEEGEKQTEIENVANPITVKAYTAKGAETTSYKDAVTFGFTVDSRYWLPEEYAIKLIAKEDNVVIYSAEATLTVENPTLGEGDVKLVPGFVDANGVYQITGAPQVAAGAVSYNLADALILNANVAEVVEFIDYDNAQYVEELRDDEAFEKYNLVVVRNDKYELKVRTWSYEWQIPAAEWSASKYNQLYKTRNIRAMISLFGNDDNVVPFDFQIEVKSEIYAEDAKTAITIDETKLVNEFGAINVSGTDADESVIDIKAAITKAISVEGTDKGKTYRLFATGKGITTGGSAAVINLTSPKTAGKYVLGTDGNIVELSLVEYLQMLDAFPHKVVEISNGQMVEKGLSIIYNDGQDHAKINTGDAKYKLTKQAWDFIWNQAACQYYNANGTAKYYDADGDGEFTDDDKADTNGDNTKGYLWEVNQKEDYETVDVARIAIYAAFKSKISFNNSSEAVSGTAGTALDKARDSRIASVEIKFNDPAVAKIYFQNLKNNKNQDIFGADAKGVVFTDAAGTDFKAITIKPVAEAPNSVTGGQVKVGMTLTVRDTWGMIMKVPFEVTVKTKK